MWVGTDGDGLFAFENGRFRNYRARDGLGGDRIRAYTGTGRERFGFSTRIRMPTRGPGTDFPVRRHGHASMIRTKLTHRGSGSVPESLVVDSVQGKATLMSLGRRASFDLRG